MSKRKHLFLLFTLIVSTGLSFNAYAGPICGDGTVNQASEECDEVDNASAPASSLCSNTEDLGNGVCKFTICGDNIIQSPNGVGFNEECDDGGASATCSVLCQTITTTTTTTTSTTAATTTSTTGATTTSTTGATTTSTTGATTTSTTGATTTSTTGATTTSTTGATTSTTGGGTTSTSTASSTTTTAASTTTTAAATTTTTQVPGEPSVDEPLEGGGTVTITTEAGEVITDVSTGDATAPSGFVFPFGTISYTTTSPVGGKVTMTFEFSAGLPDPFTLFKVDNNGENPTELPADIWNKVNATTVEVTVEDGDGLTDMGPVDGFIVDPIAVAAPIGGGDDLFDFGGGGCTISNTRSTGMDPIWLLLLLAPGLGILRRRVAAKGTRRAKIT